jgi:hypothetical protein
MSAATSPRAVVAASRETTQLGEAAAGETAGEQRIDLRKPGGEQLVVDVRRPPQQIAAANHPLAQSRQRERRLAASARRSHLLAELRLELAQAFLADALVMSADLPT